MNKLKEIRSSMAMNVIGGLVALILVFGLIVCVIGNICFVDAFKSEYSTVTYHMAQAATVAVNGDHIERYLEGGEPEEYALTCRRLDTLARKLNVSLVYVIAVDQSDYGQFVSVFNAVNNSVDDTAYTAWELGYRRDTTNDEYAQKYRALYEQGSPYETVFRMNPPGDQHPHITTLVPVSNSEGAVTGILCIQRPISEMTNAVEPYIRMILFGVVVMVITISALAARFLRKSIIDPVETVADEAARFAREHTKSVPIGELSHYDVICNLVGSIDSMETDMVSYIHNLTAVTAERERIGAELSIAATIQKDSLPEVFPAFPDRQEFDIYASMDPAREVGGDFYNFFLIDEDHLALVIADVSGKGIPASLFMMVTNILISDRAQMGGRPSEILRFVNDNICAHNRADMFVTVWLGILEISTGCMICGNAGHEYPALYRSGGEFEIVKDSHGFVIGGMEDMTYRDYELVLNRGDKLFLYTDGLPEATDCREQMFTVERMIRTLNETKDGSPQEILDFVARRVDEFAAGAEQFDDMTMLCLDYRGPASPLPPDP